MKQALETRERVMVIDGVMVIFYTKTEDYIHLYHKATTGKSHEMVLGMGVMALYANKEFDLGSCFISKVSKKYPERSDFDQMIDEWIEAKMQNKSLEDLVVLLQENANIKRFVSKSETFMTAIPENTKQQAALGAALIEKIVLLNTLKANASTPAPRKAARL